MGGVAEGEALWDLLMIMAFKALLLPLLLTTVRYSPQMGLKVEGEDHYAM